MQKIHKGYQDDWSLGIKDFQRPLTELSVCNLCFCFYRVPFLPIYCPWVFKVRAELHKLHSIV